MEESKVEHSERVREAIDKLGSLDLIGAYGMIRKEGAE